MAETNREKVQRIGRAFRDAPDVMRKGGFVPLEYADAVYRLLDNQQAATANEYSPPTVIDAQPESSLPPIEVRTISTPPAQPLMSPNNVVASSIDPNTGTEFPNVDELDADNAAISLLSDLDPRKATVQGMAYGANTAKAQNQEGLISQAADTISGLLGNVDFQGLFRVLARPEFVAPMGPGQSPLTNFVNAAAADRTAQATARAAQQKAGLEGFKAETDRLKALMPDPSKMPKLTAEVSKMYDSIESSRRISEIGNKIKAALTANPFSTTGGPGEIAKAFRGMAAMLGINPGTFDTDDVQKNIAKLKGEVLKSKTFGREASRQELEQILNKILAEPGLLTTSTQLEDSVNSLMRDAERNIYNATARLKAFGYPISTDANSMYMTERYFTRNNQKANQ